MSKLFHITTRCINKDWFSQPLEEVWEIMSNYLFFAHHAYQVKIHAFVLMINHYHLLISDLDNDLSGAMMYFNRETSRSISKSSDRINQTYGNRFFRSLIETERHYLCVYKYIYQNPIRAGLSLKAEEYPFSTLHSLTGKAHSIIPVESDNILFPNAEETLTWLNTTPHSKLIEGIRKGLKRSTFYLPADRATRKPLDPGEI